MECHKAFEKKNIKITLTLIGYYVVPWENHLRRRQLYWQKLCATHKNKIPYGESSQIDGKEAGKITFKDYHLIWWAKVGFTIFLTSNKLGYS